jgi:hypothetical protein
MSASARKPVPPPHKVNALRRIAPASKRRPMPAPKRIVVAPGGKAPSTTTVYLQSEPDELPDAGGIAAVLLLFGALAYGIGALFFDLAGWVAVLAGGVTLIAITIFGLKLGAFRTSIIFAPLGIALLIGRFAPEGMRASVGDFAQVQPSASLWYDVGGSPPPPPPSVPPVVPGTPEVATGPYIRADYFDASPAQETEAKREGYKLRTVHRLAIVAERQPLGTDDYSLEPATIRLYLAGVRVAVLPLSAYPTYAGPDSQNPFDTTAVVTETEVAAQRFLPWARSWALTAWIVDDNGWRELRREAVRNDTVYFALPTPSFSTGLYTPATEVRVHIAKFRIPTRRVRR